ncbi:MAG: hypothetical protein WCI54_08095 [Bacteroidia bacterium]
MKTLTILLFAVLSTFLLPAQNTGPIPELSRQLNQYFNYFPEEKVSIETDKLYYKPGETIWFTAFVSDGTQVPVSAENQQLYVRLYDKKGNAVVQDIFRLIDGFASGDLLVPENLTKEVYFMLAYTSEQTSAEEITTKILYIDPEYSNQWVVQTSLKDSISSPGLKNEISLVLSDLSGEIQKNDAIRYQIMNGNDILEKGKLKTDQNGKAVIPFTIPAKTNGESFICKISDNKEDWTREIFLPTNLDPVIVRFFPEGGNLNVGISAKVGFTAFNKWGIPVDVEGSLVNQDGKNVTLVKSFTKGLGLFSVMNDGTQKYKLVLAGKTGPGQSFDLPAPKTDGLSLSVLKSDAGFISANLAFADKQKHSIAIALTSGSKLNWAADMEINSAGRIKIPVDKLPQGIFLLSVFSSEGQILAERVVYVDKKLQVKLEVLPEKNKLQSGESMKVKVRMTDEKDQPVSGNVTVSVSGQFRNGTSNDAMKSSPLTGPELETPYSVLTDALKGRAASPVLMDVYLISNKIKGFSWEKIRDFKPENAKNLQPKPTDFEADISKLIAGISQKYSLLNSDQAFDKTYFSNNPELFGKYVKANRPNTIGIDTQRNLLASSTNLLDVIKILKPYKIVSNQIVFIGMDNSLKYQGGALFVIDGQQLGTDISAIAGISPLSVDHINVSTSVMDIQKYTGLNTIGVIEIFLKKGNRPEEPIQKESTSKYENGFRVPNIFPAEPGNLKNDQRTTLKWIPNQKVDETGLFEFTVTAGKVLSGFLIDVQGISPDGQMGIGNTSFTVTK